MDLTQPQYIFPILKHADILQCMSELGVELTKAELVEPQRHKERVRRVFVALLDVCSGLAEDDLAKVTPKMQATLEAVAPYPQVHENFADVRFFLELKKLLKVCGVHDFGWRDLQNPTTKRFRIQLSATINLAKFREDQLKLYAELNEPRTDMLCALEEVNDENAQLQQQLAAAHQDSQQKVQEMDQVEQECQELELEIARNNKVQSAKREEATELKKRHTELQNQLATAKLALEEAQVEYESLQAKIVSSPERRKKDLAQLQEAMQKERDHANQLEQQVQSCKTQLVHVTQACKLVPEMTKWAHQVNEQVQKVEQVQEEIAKATAEQQMVEKETQELLETDPEANLARAEEKLAHQRKQYKIKLDAAQEALDEAQQQYMEVQENHRQGLAKVKAQEEEIQQIESQMKARRAEMEEEMEDMVAQYRRVEKQVLEQTAQLLSVIETV